MASTRGFPARRLQSWGRRRGPSSAGWNSSLTWPFSSSLMGFENFGYAQQHGSVGIMATSVHIFIFRFEIALHKFLYGQCVHVDPQGDGFASGFCLKRDHDAGMSL